MKLYEAVNCMLAGKKVTNDMFFRYHDYCYFNGKEFRLVYVKGQEDPLVTLFKAENWELYKEYKYKYVVNVGDKTALSKSYFKTIEEANSLSIYHVICRADWTKELV